MISALRWPQNVEPIWGYAPPLPAGVAPIWGFPTGVPAYAPLAGFPMWHYSEYMLFCDGYDYPMFLMPMNWLGV